jgi:outer membrane protein TolC
MRFAAYLLAFTSAVGALAQNAGQRLELDEAVAEALRANPEIVAAQKRYEAARQRPAQERALPDPTISFGWNSNGNPLPGAGLGHDPTSNIGAMASQEIPYPGKLRLKGRIASQEADAEAQQFRAVQLGVISRVKQAFHRLHHAYTMLEIFERNREALRSLLRVTEARYSVGKAAQADVFRAQTQITLIETHIVQTERDRRAREAELNSLLNRPPGTPLPPPHAAGHAPLAFTLDQLMAAARDGAPMLARDQKMIERAQSSLSLAQKDRYPDFTLNAGYYSMGSMPPMYMFRADMKLPIQSGRTHAGIAEHSQQVSETRHTYEATARSLEYRIRDEYLTAETAHKLMQLYSKTVLPQAQLAVESSLASYESGALDFLSVIGNQVAAFDYEMAYHEQMLEYDLALARLEEMTGVEFKQ